MLEKAFVFGSQGGLLEEATCKLRRMKEQPRGRVKRRCSRQREHHVQSPEMQKRWHVWVWKEARVLTMEPARGYEWEMGPGHTEPCRPWRKGWFSLSVMANYWDMPSGKKRSSLRCRR